jgi:hypothetical protein
MLLQELFDPSAAFELEWDRASPGVVYATAHDRQGRTIDFVFVEIEPGVWDIEFMRGGSYGITGRGDAERVFATVLTAVQQFVQQVRPLVIVFSGKESSRARLYQSLVNRYAAQLGYQLYPLTPERADQLFGDDPFNNQRVQDSASGKLLVLKRKSP